MKKKKYRLTTLILTATLTFLLGGCLVYWLLGQQLQAARQTNASMKKIQAVYDAIYDNYYQKVSRKKLENGALNGMIAALDDQFSEYLNKKEAQSLNDTISSSFTGIGAQVQKSNGQIEIVTPIAGTPAQKAGLKAKDIILKIDGKSLKNKTLTQAVDMIRGKKGSQVTLTLKRGDKVFTKTLKRAPIPVETVSGKITSEDAQVGYIQITSFSENTTKEFKQTIKKLRKQGAKRWIIDVRNNPGGLLDQALNLSSMFLKNGQTIMQVKQRQGQAQIYRAQKKYDGGFKVKEKAVVLINEGSASAAEIFAAALHQSANIKLVGTKSFGKGTVQTTAPFEDQTELKLTIAKWLTPNGQWIHQKGLQPDVKVSDPVAELLVLDPEKASQIMENQTQVTTLQKYLQTLGYQVQETQNYDAQTKQAVMQFQQANDLTADGTLNYQTVALLDTKLSQYLAAHDLIYQSGLQSLTE